MSQKYVLKICERVPR